MQYLSFFLVTDAENVTFVQKLQEASGTQETLQDLPLGHNKLVTMGEDEPHHWLTQPRKDKLPIFSSLAKDGKHPGRPAGEPILPAPRSAPPRSPTPLSLCDFLVPIQEFQQKRNANTSRRCTSKDTETSGWVNQSEEDKSICAGKHKKTVGRVKGMRQGV